MSKKTKQLKPKTGLYRPPPEDWKTIKENVGHGGARDGAGRHTTGRKSLTLYIRADIIEACRPHPAVTLRKWIEKKFKKLEKNA